MVISMEVDVAAAEYEPKEVVAPAVIQRLTIAYATSVMASGGTPTTLLQAIPPKLAHLEDA